MSNRDQKIIDLLMESNPSAWPAGMRRPSPAIDRDAPDPAVDPVILDSIRLRRSRRERRRRHWTRGLVAAGVLLLLGLGVFQFGSAPAARVTDMAGIDQSDLSVGTALADGRDLELPPGSFLKLNIGSRAILQLGGPGEFKLESNLFGRRNLSISSGRALLVSRGEDIAIRFTTPRGIYRRSGTTALLNVREDSDLLLVGEGSITLDTGGNRYEVGAQDKLEWQGPAAPRVVKQSQAEVRRLVDLADVALRTKTAEAPEAREKWNLAQIAAVYGPLYRVRLASGEVLEGHLYTRGGRTFVITPDGTRTLSETAIIRLQRIPAPAE